MGSTFISLILQRFCSFSNVLQTIPYLTGYSQLHDEELHAALPGLGEQQREQHGCVTGHDRRQQRPQDRQLRRLEQGRGSVW